MQSIRRDFGGIVVLSWQLAQTWQVWGSFFNVSIFKRVAKNVMCECSNCCYRNSLQRARTGYDSLHSNTHFWPCYMRNDLEGYFYCGPLVLCPVRMSLLGLHIAGQQNTSPFLWKHQALIVLWKTKQRGRRERALDPVHIPVQSWTSLKDLKVESAVQKDATRYRLHLGLCKYWKGYHSKRVCDEFSIITEWRRLSATEL